jgi:hypothetical protein
MLEIYKLKKFLCLVSTLLWGLGRKVGIPLVVVSAILVSAWTLAR